MRRGPGSGVIAGPSLSNGHPSMRCQLRYVRCQLPLMRCQLPLMRCQRPLIRCQLALMRCQPPSMRCQSPSIHCHHPTMRCQPPSLRHGPRCLCYASRFRCCQLPWTSKTPRSFMASSPKMRDAPGSSWNGFSLSSNEACEATGQGCRAHIATQSARVVSCSCSGARSYGPDPKLRVDEPAPGDIPECC